MRQIAKIPYQTAFVVNPSAGEGKAKHTWSRVESELQKYGQQYRVYFTSSAGEATGLAARAAQEGAKLIVAVGGDGTLRETVSGLDLGKNVFGAIPAGTGNGFVRSCKIPLHWRKALRGLSCWNPQPVDLGIINNTVFLNIIGFGFDGAVVEKAATKYRRLKGYLAYLAAFLDHAGKFKRFHCKARCNGFYFEENQAILAFVANGSYYGGKLRIAPQAAIDDGYLDLCLFRRRNIPEVIGLGARVAIRWHLSSRATLVLKGRKLYLETRQKVPAHIDGDLVEMSSAEIKIKPSALRILAPELLNAAPQKELSLSLDYLKESD